MILIDLVLAGDNAIVVGIAAASVDPRHRKKVICRSVGQSSFATDYFRCSYHAAFRNRRDHITRWPTSFVGLLETIF